MKFLSEPVIYWDVGLRCDFETFGFRVEGLQNLGSRLELSSGLPAKGSHTHVPSV